MYPSTPCISEDSLSPPARSLVQQMGDSAGDMWNQAASAWYRRDADAAAELDKRDDALDGLHSALTSELVSSAICQQTGPSVTAIRGLRYALTSQNVLPDGTDRSLKVETRVESRWGCWVRNRS
jgi:hypothetical protein